MPSSAIPGDVRNWGTRLSSGKPQASMEVQGALGRVQGCGGRASLQPEHHHPLPRDRGTCWGLPTGFLLCFHSWSTLLARNLGARGGTSVAAVSSSVK